MPGPDRRGGQLVELQRAEQVDEPRPLRLLAGLGEVSALLLGAVEEWAGDGLADGGIAGERRRLDLAATIVEPVLDSLGHGRDGLRLDIGALGDLEGEVLGEGFGIALAVEEALRRFPDAGSRKFRT